MNKRFDFVVKQFGFNLADNNKVVIKGYANRYKTSDGNVVVDRSRESIPISAYDLDNFMKNPVLLYQHNQGDIIGKVINININAEGLLIEAEVYKDLNEKVFFAIKEGLLKAFSVGFIAKDYEYDEANDIWYWTQVELLEVSVVSVPDNQESLFVELLEPPCQDGVCLMGITDYNKKAKEKGITMELKAIKNSVISEKVWSSVNKTELGQKLAELGRKSYIDECYLVVGDYEKRSTWKFPHHELDGEDLIVNKNGVVAAYAALQGARNNPNISAIEKKKAAEHLLKHYKEMYKQGMIEEIPKELEDMVKEFSVEIEKMFADLEENIKEIENNDTNIETNKEDNVQVEEKEIKTKAARDIVDNNQNNKEGDQLAGGDKGELIVNITPNSVLTAYPVPPQGYRIRRYVKDKNKTYEFVIGKSEIAKLLAFMRDYFNDRDDNGNKKSYEEVPGEKEVKTENEVKTEKEDVINFIKENKDDIEGLSVLLEIYGELENTINNELNKVLSQKENKE